MKSKILKLKLTDNQLKLIRKFLLGHKIKCDGNNPFGLVAEPKIDSKKVVVRLLSIKQTIKLDKFFEKLKLYDKFS